MEGIKQETKNNTNDNVRFFFKKVTFSKGSLPSWSSTIHKIENKNLHSYILDNGKTFKYYELQTVNNVQGYVKEHIKDPTRDNIRKDNQRNKLFIRDNLDTSKILNTERKRKIRPESQELLSI